SPPVDDGWNHNLNTGSLFHRLLDNDDPTDLVFLVTDRSVLILTAENRRVLVHEVFEAPTATDLNATREEDQSCSTEDQLATHTPRDATWHALALDGRGNLLPASGLAATRAAGYRGDAPKDGSPDDNPPGAAGTDRTHPGWAGTVERPATRRRQRAAN